jgi:hypothetical protein
MSNDPGSSYALWTHTAYSTSSPPPFHVLQTLSTLEGSHSAVSNIFLEQAAQYESSPGEGKPVLPASLMADHTYQRVYSRIKASICQKGRRDTTVDPQRNAIKDTYDADDLQHIVDCLMEKGTPETDRALAMAMWSHSSVGRSADVRLFYLADLITPQYIPAVGEFQEG